MNMQRNIFYDRNSVDLLLNIMKEYRAFSYTKRSAHHRLLESFSTTLCIWLPTGT